MICVCRHHVFVVLQAKRPHIDEAAPGHGLSYKGGVLYTDLKRSQYRVYKCRGDRVDFKFSFKQQAQAVAFQKALACIEDAATQGLVLALVEGAATQG